jgi:uncharacterized protein
MRLILLALLTWLFIKYALPPLLASLTRPQNGPTTAQPNPEPTSGDMVRCAHCQVYVLRSESIYSQNHFYCCKEHFLAGPRS